VVPSPDLENCTVGQTKKRKITVFAGA
jgi:hypothetical protein